MSELQDLEFTLFNYQGKTYKVKYQKAPASNVNYELITKDVGPDDKLTIETPPDSLTQREVIVIDSVNSGVGRENRDYYSSVLKPLLDEFKIKYEYLKTANKHSIKDFSKTLSSEKKYTLIFLSGDTSIFEFFNSIPVKHDVQLGLIPLGSGNSMAHSSKIEDEFHALQSIFGDEPAVKLPLYKVTFPDESIEVLSEEKTKVKELYFAIIVSWAIHSQIVYNAERPELRHLGVERFKVAFGEVLQSNLQYPATLHDLKGNNLSDLKYHSYLNVLPVSEIERGYVISPDSKISENKLHLVDIGDVSNQEIAQIILLPYQNGAHINHPKVHYKALEDGITIKLDEEENQRANICVDGIIIQVQNPKGKEIKIDTIPEDRFGIRIIGLKP